MDKDGLSSPSCHESHVPLSEQPDNGANNRGGVAEGRCSPQQQQSYLGEVPDQVGDKSLSSFNRLPLEVIEHILYIVDANTFASLALLNQKWRRASDSPLLYAYHLSRCPSFSLTKDMISAPVGFGDLASLKRKFSCEIRRNAFEVFLRPRRTLIKLMSTSMSSSTAFPQGEAFRFVFSANGQMLLCLSSSRIVVLDVSLDTAVVMHELKTWRRPLGATILDDGSLLAVVSSKHQVNVYSLSDADPKLIQVITLNDAPRTLTLSPTGSVLALAYNDNIEVYALGEGALSTERRAVRCVGVDSISFSSDGVMLLGSSVDNQQNSIVTITAPFYTESGTESSPRDIQVRMWTTQILFPDVVTGYSHACLLPPHAAGEDNWILGYDNQIATFKAVNVSSTKTGATYFASPLSDDGSREALPSTIPTIDCRGELFASSFEGCGLWLYGVPDRLDIASVASPILEAHDTLDTGSTAGHIFSATQPDVSPRDNSTRLRRILNQPSILVSGHQVTDMQGITAARWVQPTHLISEQPLSYQRLVAVAPGGVSSPTFGEEDVPIDGGRVLLLDFQRSTQDGETIEINIEIGETEPKMLKEQNPSMDTEVELERRRTRLRRGGAASQPIHRDQPLARAASRDSYPAASAGTQKRASHIRRNSSYLSSSSNDMDPGNGSPVLDAPYDNTQPRSRDTLHRAATAAAATRGRYNPRYRSPSHFERQIPHESDADNWVPPPPPYTREPDAPLPEHLRRTLLPSTTEPVQSTGDPPPQVRRSQTTRLETVTQEAVSRSQSAIQRLNTITSSRLGTRLRRNPRDPSSPVTNNQIESHAGPQPLVGQNAGLLEPQPQQQRPVMAGERSDIDTRPSSPLSSALSTSPHEIPSLAPPQLAVSHPRDPEPPEPLSQDVDEEPTLNDWTNLDLSVPFAGNNSSARNYYPYSISSPNLLHIPEPSYLVDDTRQNTDHQQAVDRRSQSQDIQSPFNRRFDTNLGISPLGRRVSTDPTSLALPSASSNEDWRRRIEEWNEQTIYERSKRGRNKCVVM